MEYMQHMCMYTYISKGLTIFRKKPKTCVIPKTIISILIITYSNRTVNMYYALLHWVKTHKKKPNNNNKEKPTQQQQKHDLNKIKLH